MNITGGKFNSRKVFVPDSDKVRPTLSKIRESVFNMLSSLIDFENANFLDVFSGSGIISLEAVSRGFKKVVSIEKDYKTAKVIMKNFAQLDLIPNLIVKDAVKALDKIEEKFDVIYLDPPYKEIDLYNTIFKIIADKELLTSNGVIITESQKETEYIVPRRFSLIKEKTYGDTLIKIYR